jgi:hypothetical protein
LPLSAGIFAVATESTSASALISGRLGGGSLAPAGMASTPSPTTPASTPAPATASAVFLVFIRLLPDPRR